jgi:alpha-2-macroglobulin
MSVRAVFHALAIMLATLSASPLMAQDATRKVVTTQNGDYFGFDLRTEQNVSQPQCETICINDKACKAFTYNPKV